MLSSDPVTAVMQNINDTIMPLSIALIMVGIGLELRFRDFRHILLRPKAVVIGLAGQLLLLPIIAFVLVLFWPLEPVYQLGIMLLAACPGGTASNVVTKILGGRVALSVSLTAFNSFIILGSLPLVLHLSFLILAGKEGEVNLTFINTMQEVLITVVLPVMCGIILNEYYGKYFRDRIHKPLKYLLPAIMLIAFLSAVFLDEPSKEIDYLDHLGLLLPLLILNLLTMITGYGLGFLFKLKHRSSYTIAIEMGLQNSVLALFIANQILEVREISLVAILYSSFSLVSTFLLAWLLKLHGPGERKGDQAP